ncbi:2987_t:CDS:2, partial [Cetraspora pellucida]
MKNLLKSYFGNDLLLEIHASLNNLDPLHYLVTQVQNLIHPHGQGILGLVHAFSSNLDNIQEYVQKIVLTYVRIFTNIITANAYHRMFKAIIETVNELCKQEVQIKHIHDNGWKVILDDLDVAQAKGLGLVLEDLDLTKTWKTHLTYIFKSYYLKSLMYEILVADKERVDAIFYEFFISDKDGASASLNYYYSHILKEDWCNARETTNIAESAHADANREEIKMNLLLAIRNQKYKKKESASSTKKVSPNSNATAIGNEELNDIDLEIAKHEKLRKL